MNKLETEFESKNVILPVIHVQSFEHALRNAKIAREAGANGVFLINMGNSDGTRIGHAEIKDILLRLKEEKDLSSWWIGVNYLDLSANDAVRNAGPEQGIWTDDLITEKREDLNSVWDGTYFGGVAFKYRKQPADISRAAKEATEYLDVVTTSGIGTGISPDIRKIEEIRQSIGDFPLAIASGISFDNIKYFSGVVDCFIVATSILKPNSEEIDEEKLRVLISASS